MSRRHWKFIVRDAYGYVIQNAKVNVYLPGTTTVFSGTAYNAASGGSPVTNPFTTNAQGEVEAWFDTAQLVDVAVDDNSDTAYRAVDGAGGAFSFSPFTEQDSIYVSADDQVSRDFGETGDIVATLVNPFTAVTGAAGASGEYADAAHVHPFTALTPAAPETLFSAASAGTDTDPARQDHKHKLASALGKTAKFTKTTTAEEVVHTLTVPANVCAAGSMFRIRVNFFQTNGTTACTFTFRVRWGGLAGVLLGSALALVGTTTAHTDTPMSLDALVTIQSIGGTGTATMTMNGFETITTAVSFTRLLTSSAQAAAATIDTTVNKDLVFTAELSTTTGSPNIEVDDIIIEQVA